MWLFAFALAAEHPPPDLTRRVDVVFQDAELHAALRFFADVGGFDLVVGDDVQGKVTMQLHDVRLQDALQVVLVDKGLRYTVTGRVLTVK